MTLAEAYNDPDVRYLEALYEQSTADLAWFLERILKSSGRRERERIALRTLAAKRGRAADFERLRDHQRKDRSWQTHEALGRRQVERARRHSGARRAPRQARPG
jgi:hypothetical protein